MNNKINRRKVILVLLAAASLPHAARAMTGLTAGVFAAGWFLWESYRIRQQNLGERLRTAISANNIQEVRRLLAMPGINVDAANTYGGTALMEAAHRGQQECVKALIDSGADVNAVQTGDPVLILEAMLFPDDQEVAKALRASGANVNAADRQGWTALMGAAHKGRQKVVQTLIDNGANVNAVDSNGCTALIWGDQKVVKLLIASGANVNAVNKHGGTALMKAAMFGHQEVAKALIASGADVNAVDKNGETALMKATRNCHPEVVKLLIDLVD